MSLEEEEQWSLKSEIEALKAIYVNELEVKYDECDVTLTVHLHPSTADVETEKFVRLSLTLGIHKEYPDVVPELKIENTRGLSDSDIERIYSDASHKAEECRGIPMLFEIIEVTKECLTKGNTPNCSCAICLYGFTTEDVFTKTDCYHYFHSFCLATYMRHCQKEWEEQSQTEESRRNEKEFEVLCPICRLFITFHSVLPEKFPPPEESGKDESFVLTEDMRETQSQIAAIYRKQQSRGGIIDVEAEKNKFLLEISQVPTLPLQLISPVIPVPSTAEGRKVIQDSHSKHDNRTPHSRNTRQFAESNVKNVKIRSTERPTICCVAQIGHKTSSKMSSNFSKKKEILQDKIEVAIPCSNDVTKDNIVPFEARGKAVLHSKADLHGKVTENIADADDRIPNYKRKFSKYKNIRKNANIVSTTMKFPSENASFNTVRRNSFQNDNVSSEIQGVNHLESENTTKVTNYYEQNSENVRECSDKTKDLEELQVEYFAKQNRRSDKHNAHKSSKSDNAAGTGAIHNAPGETDFQKGENRDAAGKSSSHDNYRPNRRQYNRLTNLENRNLRNSGNNLRRDSELDNEDINHCSESTYKKKGSTEWAEIESKEQIHYSNSSTARKGKETEPIRNQDNKAGFNSNYRYNGRQNWPRKKKYGRNYPFTESESTSFDVSKSNPDIDSLSDIKKHGQNEDDASTKATDSNSILKPEGDKNKNVPLTENAEHEKSNFYNNRNGSSNYNRASKRQYNKQAIHENANQNYQDNVYDSSHILPHESKRQGSTSSTCEIDSFAISQKNSDMYHRNNRNRQQPNNPGQGKERQYNKQSSCEEGRQYGKQSSLEFDSADRGGTQKSDNPRNNRNEPPNVAVHGDERQNTKPSNRESDSHERCVNQKNNYQRRNKDKPPNISHNDKQSPYHKQSSHDDERPYTRQSNRDEERSYAKQSCPDEGPYRKQSHPDEERQYTKQSSRDEERTHTKQSHLDEKRQYSKQSSHESDGLEKSGNQRNGDQRRNKNKQPNIPCYDDKRPLTRQSSCDQERTPTKQSHPDEKRQYTKQSSRESEGLERSGNQRKDYQRRNKYKPPNIRRYDEETSYTKQSSHDEERLYVKQSSRHEKRPLTKQLGPEEEKQYTRQSSQEIDSLEREGNQKKGYQSRNKNKPPDIPRHNEERPYTKQSSCDEGIQNTKQSNFESNSVKSSGNPKNDYQKNNSSRAHNSPRHDERHYTMQSSYDEERQHNKQSNRESDSFDRCGKQNDYQRNNRNRIPNKHHDEERQRQDTKQSSHESDSLDQGGNQKNRYWRNNRNRSSAISHQDEKRRYSKQTSYDEGRQYNKQSCHESECLERPRNQKNHYQSNNRNILSDKPHHDEHCDPSEDNSHLNPNINSSSEVKRTDNVELVESDLHANKGPTKGQYSKFRHNRWQYNQQPSYEGDHLGKSENRRKYQKNNRNNTLNFHHVEDCNNSNVMVPMNSNVRSSYSSETSKETDNVQVDKFPLDIGHNSMSLNKKSTSDRQRNNSMRKGSANLSDTVSDQSKECLENVKCVNYGSSNSYTDSTSVLPCSESKGDSSHAGRFKFKNECFKETTGTNSVHVSNSGKSKRVDQEYYTFHKGPTHKMQESKQQILESAPNSLQCEQNTLFSSQTRTGKSPFAQEITLESQSKAIQVKETVKRHSTSTHLEVPVSDSPGGDICLRNDPRSTSASSEKLHTSEMQHHDPIELLRPTSNKKGPKKVEGQFCPPGFPACTVTNRMPPGFTMVSVNDRPPPGFAVVSVNDRPPPGFSQK